MASTGKKEYTFRVNGIKETIKDATKLEEVLNTLDVTIKRGADVNLKATAATKQKTAALSEEEKAAKKLADTQARIAKANSEENRAQIAANQELRERTREVSRSIAINQLAEGSIAEMGMTLTDLRVEYENLSAAQRANEAEGGALLTQIQALDAEYKALRESTGNFRDSVGNYAKATQGLNELKDKFELAARGGNNLANSVTGSNSVLDAFGNTTEVVAQSTEQLAGVTALAGVAMETYNAVVKEGVIQQKAAAVMDGIRSIQLKAKTAAEALSTKGTIAATVAQKIFNVVAAANPYVLLALALIAVGAALYAFASSTDDAAEEQQKLNDLQAIYLEQLEAEANKLKERGDARVKDAETTLAILEAGGAKTKEIRDAEDKLAQERRSNNIRQRAFYAQELDDLEKNRAKVEEFRKVLIELNKAKAEGEDKIKLDIDLDGKIDKVKVDEAITAVQGSIDNANRTVQIAVDLNTEKAELDAQAKVLAAQRLKADRDLAKERADKAKETAKQRASLELSAERAAEDARLKLIDNTYLQARRSTEIQYARQISDLKRSLAEEANLTLKAKKAINDNIAALAKLRDQELKALEKEQAAKVLETTRQTEDSRTALIVGQVERRRAETNLQYNRAYDDLRKRLENEKDLTKEQQDAIADQMINTTIARDRVLAGINAENLHTQAQLELAALDSLLAASQAKIGEVVKRDGKGLKLIDVDATRANLAAANEALGEYVGRIQKYQQDLKAAHEATLDTLQAGTPEYIAEVQKYVDAEAAATAKIKAAQAEQIANTKQSKGTQLDYYKELGAKVVEYAQLASDAIGGVFSTVNMGLQSQVEEMQAALEVVNKQYEAAQKQREDAVKNVEDIEARLQSATGGTAKALQDQLADAKAARNEANREEQRLAKEKEKREADIAKKERQMKRNDLIANIAVALSNTAQGVTQALTLPFPLNLIQAAVVGTLGAVQVGIMGKNLAKLAKGGRIEGAPHSQGGVDLAANYEVEGGEFMVNKRSFAANESLIEFINASPSKVTAGDLLGIVPQDGAPEIGDQMLRGDNDDLIEAIEGIDMKPRVAVDDIRRVESNLVEVEDLAGFTP